MVTDSETAAGTNAAEGKGEIYNGSTPRGAAARRFSISGDVIARTVADLPDREREAIKWLAGYCTAKNLSHRDVADKLRKEDGEPYHPDSLYQAFTGRREASQLTPLAAAIETFRRLVEENTVRLEIDFIENPISKKMWDLCDKARRRHKIALIYGESQIGKSTSLIVYKERHNHGETIYVRMPTHASMGVILRELAIVLNISPALKTIELRRAVMNCFDERMLLIVDEAHEASAAALNFCREIHDRRKCGVVFAGTNVLRQSLTSGVEAKNFRQLLLRGLPPLLLPAQPSPAVLAAFARAYDLGPAGEEAIGARVSYVDDAGRERTQTITIAPAALQAQVIARDGLGRWCTILQEARELAKEKRRPITWGGVIAAWQSFERLGQFTEEEAAS